MLSDLNWKRSNVRGEAQCSRCSRTLLGGQNSIQIDRSRVCIKCWDEVRADPTKSVQEYKSEFRIGSGSPARRSSSSGRSGGARKAFGRRDIRCAECRERIGGVIAHRVGSAGEMHDGMRIAQRIIAPAGDAGLVPAA